jgi:dipeptidase
MEMIGKGVGNKGAVWVAIRIPDDCISAHANQSRIHQIPFDDKENCMYSPDVVSFAREKGYFNGKDKDFSFTKAYCPYDFSALRGCEARVWAFMRKYDKSLDAYLPFLKGESDKPMPLYVKADRKLTLQDVKNGMRDHYEGTEFCMTNDAGMGPYKVPYRWRPMTFKVDGQEYVNERAIATQQTGFVLCAQLRNWLPDAIGGVLWFGVDDAATAVFTPMYGSIKETPECFRVGNGDMMTFSWTSAFWIHNWVANMAYSKYSFMIEDIKPVQKELELGFEAMQPSIDKAAADMYAKNPEEAVKFLTWYSTTEANRSTARWKQLGEYLVVKYIDGNVKKEVNGKFMQNGYGLSASPNFPGYDETYYRSIVNSAGERLKVK